jgi:two-component system alkaline phosphatase synthesis response regulator PhoP
MDKRILVVDDERDVLDMLGARLEAAGYNVLKASGGIEGLAKAKDQRPALIILDVLMPDMPGNEVAEQLGADPGTKDIPVIFLTATLTKEQEKACRSVGKTFFLSKPYEPEELISIVSRLVGLV